MIHIQFTLLLSVLAAFRFAEPSPLEVPDATGKGEDDICDPHLLTYSQYPGLLTKIDVVATKPLKTRMHFRLINSTKEVSFEGIVFGGSSGSLTDAIALVACRSLGCSKLAARHATTWIQTQTCRFTCPDGVSALQTCRYMLNYLKCPTDAMSFIECTGNPWSQYASSTPELYGTELICTECGEN
jgi:hypothetical protein